MLNNRIALVPLDNRPCCYQFPKRIGGVAGVEVLTPPESLLGKYTAAGNYEAVKSWLIEQAPAVSGMIICIDQLAYGGLVASRAPDRTLAECLETLSVIPELKRRFPELKIYVSNVLMRISITYKNREYLQYGRLIFQYSQLYDRVHRLGEEVLREELEHLKRKIPSEVLNDYLQARSRNHEVNKQMIEWAAQGLIDFLTITQEDASPVGMHIEEQRLLMQQIYERKVQNKVMIYPGADEGTLTLLSRLLLERDNRKVRIYPKYASTSGRLAVADFEDRPIEETVKSHILAAGGVVVEHPADADIVLFVNTPLQEKGVRPTEQKAFFHSRHNYWDIVASLKHELSKGAHVALADAAITNASDVELVQYMLQEDLYFDLLAYAGWNTAGNTIGTAVSQAVARWLAKERGAPQAESEQAHYSFLIERLLDEWAYQAQVRGEVNQWVESQLKLNPTDLEGYYEQVNLEVVGRIQAVFQSYADTWLVEIRRRMPETAEVSGITLQKVYLPWNRTFEVGVQVECELKC